MGRGLTNPTAMILSAAMMLDWLADRHSHNGAAAVANAVLEALRA
jgi:3-isopropylmalate dehydrogenase